MTGVRTGVGGTFVEADGCDLPGNIRPELGTNFDGVGIGVRSCRRGSRWPDATGASRVSAAATSTSSNRHGDGRCRNLYVSGVIHGATENGESAICGGSK